MTNQTLSAFYMLWTSIAHLACSSQAVTEYPTKQEVSIAIKQEATTPACFKKLVGEWQRTNDEQGYSTFETWRQISAYEFEGHGYTLIELDTTFQEWISLKKQGDGYVFTVRGPKESPTPFILTSIDAQGFTAFNAENEFPNEIRYVIKEESILATISGSGHHVNFHFDRITK